MIFHSIRLLKSKKMFFTALKTFFISVINIIIIIIIFGPLLAEWSYAFSPVCLVCLSVCQLLTFLRIGS